jgi:fibronectin type 3 domain-containing protein
MKRRLLVLWMAMVVGMALLSMCGGARVGYQGGYDTAYRGQARGGYSAGGGSAGWDTLMVIFHPGARVDSTAATGKWLFPVPTAYTGADTVKNPRQNHRIWRLNDKILGRGNYPGGGSWRADNGDTASVLRLGTGKAVPTFAWSNIKQADTNGYYPAQFVVNHMERRQIISSVGYLRQKISAVGDSSIIPMFYIPFEDHIPANSTIVSAMVNYCSPNAAYQGVGDTIISVLMTNEGDDEWYKTKGGTGMTNSPNYAHASWLRQTDDNGDTWDGDENNAWSPGLTARGYYWSMGNTSDWSGSIMAATSYYYAEQAIPVDITDCVQSAVVGETNNGIMHIQKSTSTNNRDNTLYGWDAYSTAAKHEPYVAVKYITKRYQKPFGSSDWAFVFQTDDWRAIANKAYADTVAAYGGKYTLFGAKTHLGVVGVNDQTRGLSLAELFAVYDKGHEIGSHSKFHDGSKAIMNRIRAAGTGIGSAAYDSSVVNMGPNWMYAVADSARALGIIDRDLRTAPDYAKSFGAPVSFLTAYSQRALKDLGYDAWRTLSTFSSFDREKYYTTPPTAAQMSPGYIQHADSSMTGAVTQYGRHVRNMKEYVPHDWTLRIVGPPDSNSTSPLHLPKVAHNMRRLIEQRRGNDTRVVNFFIHDLKSGGSGFYAGEGLNADELGRICYVVNQNNGRYMTFAEMGRWFQDGATAIDYPFDNSRPDTFLVDASDRVWFKPDGVDNRWIRGIRAPSSVANSFDTTAPLSPTLYVASGSDETALVMWAPSLSPDVQYYNVYRYFDGASAVKIGTATGIYYYDNTAINGSPHNYYVKAVDYAGNESAASATMTTTPGTIMSLASPAYFGFWYQDAADSTPLSDADVSKLAAYDAVVCSPHPLELNNETGYDNLVTRVRATNPDAIMLTYFDGLTPWHDWGVSFPAGSSGKRIWDYCISAAADSGAFAKDISGDVVHGDVYPNQMFYNVMNTTLADTIASILVDVIQQTGVDGEYTGFFIDDADTLLADWICNGGECGDFIDYDQDTVAFNDDADEKAAVQNWHIDFARAMRREFAEHNMPNRLLVPNGSWGRSADPSPKQAAYMGLIDGYLNENWNQYWPGHAIATDTAKWDLALGMASQLTHAQTSPPLVFWSARTDSSDQFMNEVISMATAGFVGANNSSDIHGTTGVPVMGRRIAALEPSGSASIQYGEVAANASPDTLAVTRGNLVGRMILGRANPDSAAFVWPYVIYTATGDTLSRSLYWERAGEEGAPPVAQSQILTGDRMLTLAIGAGLGDYVPSDFSHFLIAREYKISSTAYYDTFTVDPDTLDSVYGATGSWWWYDTGLTNGRQYKYKVFSVDVLGNVGTPAPQVTQTPGDITPPAVPANLVASGGDGFIDLDWSFPVTAADFAHFRIWRALGDGAFALHDSVEISAHQDSTAISGQDYRYKVVSVDDDWNASLPSSIATGAWIGSPPATYLAPQLVRVIPNYTSTATAVLVYPPQDVTGLTGYTVYRGPWNGVASTDTTACIKRISINATPDSYNAHTFIDNTANTTPDSAFQYTAVALYSGNRSAKYSPPAGAFTDGGFAATTPTVGAFGNGANILLACRQRVRSRLHPRLPWHQRRDANVTGQHQRLGQPVHRHHGRGQHRLLVQGAAVRRGHGNVVELLGRQRPCALDQRSVRQPDDLRRYRRQPVARRGRDDLGGELRDEDHGCPHALRRLRLVLRGAVGVNEPRLE